MAGKHPDKEAAEKDSTAVKEELPVTIWDAITELRNVQRATLGILGVQFQAEEATDINDYPLDEFLNEVLDRIIHDIRIARTIYAAAQRVYIKVRP